MDGTPRDDVERLWAEIEHASADRNVDLVVLNGRPAGRSLGRRVARGHRLKIASYGFFIQKMLEISDEAEFMQDFTLDLYAMRRKWRESS